MGEVAIQFGHEFGIFPQAHIGLGELGQGRHQRLGDVLTAEIAETPVGVGPALEILDRGHLSEILCKLQVRAATNGRQTAKIARIEVPKKRYDRRNTSEKLT